jgi:hypothetical protein
MIHSEATPRRSLRRPRRTTGAGGLVRRRLLSADDPDTNRYATAVGCLGGGVLLAALLTERHFGSEWSGLGLFWIGWQALPFALISIGIASRSVRQ